MIEWASRQNPDSAPAKLLLMMLAAMADKQGVCSPNLDKLSHDCCMSRQTVMTATTRLTDKGMIQVIKRSGGNAHGSMSLLYILSIPESQRDINLTMPTVARFDDWWKLYPVKKAKQVARKAWTKAGLERKADELIEALQNQIANDDQWKQGIGIPHPSTYLNQERWADEISRPVCTDRNTESGELYREMYDDAVARERGASGMGSIQDQIPGPVDPAYRHGQAGYQGATAGLAEGAGQYDAGADPAWHERVGFGVSAECNAVSHSLQVGQQDTGSSGIQGTAEAEEQGSGGQGDMWH